MNTKAQLRKTPFQVQPVRLASTASGASVKTPVSQIETQKIERAKADREQQRGNKEVAGVDCDGHGKSSHIGADEGVFGRHEYLGFADAYHLDRKFLELDI
jgi:hypothetical protein